MILKRKLTALGLSLLVATLVGCKNQATQNDSKEPDYAHSQPMPRLHKPKTLTLAVARLSEIHQSLNSADGFRNPINVQYVEVVHEGGSSGHSHFYLAEDYKASGGEIEHDDPFEDDHSSETVKHLSMDVEVRTELTDIVSWLPRIAGKSDLAEADWQRVDGVSKKLSTILQEIPADASDTAFRESWKQKSTDVQAALDALQAIVATPTGGTE